MTNLEIKQQIDSNNKIIENLFTPNIFTLNNTVATLLRENEELQKKCRHSFKGGYCEFCYLEDTND